MTIPSTAMSFARIEEYNPKAFINSNAEMTVTNPLHYSKSVQKGIETKKDEPTFSSFGQMLLQGLDLVNNAENKADSLRTQAIIDPESVNAHDITIASKQAEMSVKITTAVIKRALEAYRSIMAIR